VGYGALNAILFATYNRSLSFFAQKDPSPSLPSQCSLSSVWAAGAIGGFATFVVSAPTELVKCRAQVWTSYRPDRLRGAATGDLKGVSSLGVAREIWKTEGVRGFFRGGGVTSIRDAVGYGF
jgi:solute carrier family 25 (mitochondrial carnitine/acylcarnitine transporter), member 20/29